MLLNEQPKGLLLLVLRAVRSFYPPELLRGRPLIKLSSDSVGAFHHSFLSSGVWIIIGALIFPIAVTTFAESSPHFSSLYDAVCEVCRLLKIASQELEVLPG